MPCRIKICGLTNEADIQWVNKCEADYIGMLIDIPQSARCIPLERAVHLSQFTNIPIVTVTVNAEEDRLLEIVSQLNPHAIQLHGNEPPALVEVLKSQTQCKVWKVIHLPAQEANQEVALEPVLQSIKDYQSAGTDAVLVDSMVVVKGETHLGGTGKTSDWNTAAKIRQESPLPVILAGGINPSNVQQAVRTVQPYAIDVSSGVELTKTKKDPDKVQELIMKVRQMEKDSPKIV